MSEIIALHEILGNNVSSENHHVKDRVVQNLRLFIPTGIMVGTAQAITINFAVNHLCKVDDIDDIDYPAIIALASNICTLWNKGWTNS